MASWPVSLPQAPLLDGFGYRPAAYGLIATEMDAGPPKVRRRFTAQGSALQASWLLTGAQFTTFRDFFETELAQGAGSFTAEHPLPAYPIVTLRFDPAQPPELRKVGQDLWRVDAQLLVVTVEAVVPDSDIDTPRVGSGGGLAGPAGLGATATVRLRGSATAATTAVTAFGSNTTVPRVGTAAVTLSAATSTASGTVLPPSDMYQGGIYDGDVHAA